MNWAKLSVILAACFAAQSVSAQTAMAAATPTPKATQLPVTKSAPELNNSATDSVPFLTADRNLRPYDLKKLGYAEEEFLISGTANVYRIAADGSPAVKTPNVPYATRILVRHPSDQHRFSGTVVVELMNPARRFDWAMMFGFLSDEIVERGDAWVGITLPGATPGLKTFNAKRYAAVSFANPTPGTCADGRKAADIEDGLKWDMISQVGAALKSNVAGRPLEGFKVEYLFMTTQASPSGLATYINLIHPRAKLAGGKPIYDGYLIKNGGNAGALNQCDPAPPAAAQVIKPAGVPVIAVIPQGALLDSLQGRRPDSDDAADRYRRYEISGGSHLDKFPYAALPSMADAGAAGNALGTPDWPFPARCEPEIQLIQYPLMPYTYHAALMNLDQWARKGTAPPRAGRIEVKDAGTDQATVVTDRFGNGVGGVRNYYSDIPVAKYFMSSSGPGMCYEQGHTEALDWIQLEELYGSQKAYAARVSEYVNRAVKDRWLTESDARRIKADATAPPALRASTTSK